MKKVWIDTDPGIDDAFAMAMLFADPEIEVVGVSTIFGNVTVEQTTKNARILLEAAGKTHIPVCRGASFPLGVPLLSFTEIIDWEICPVRTNHVGV